MRLRMEHSKPSNMKKALILSITFLSVLQACDKRDSRSDASGTFEAEEVIVSAELSGRLVKFTVEEGDSINSGQLVGNIDAENISLQKQQVEATITSLAAKTSDVTPQIELLQNQVKVQQSQLENLLHEKERTERLLKADAATGKQLDDINSQIDIIRKQILVTQQQVNVQKNSVGTQNRSILSERGPLEKRIEQLNEQLSKSQIVNPINGIVLTKYAEQGEITAAGKALYKISDLSSVTLRAYVTGVQLPQIKIKQSVTVLVDDGPDKYKRYPGTITWISDKAEFTPKTIQTKEERANLVYAIKVKVKNDGYLKIGMYGELLLNTQTQSGKNE